MAAAAAGTFCFTRAGLAAGPAEKKEKESDFKVSTKGTVKPTSAGAIMALKLPLGRALAKAAPAAAPATALTPGTGLAPATPGTPLLAVVVLSDRPLGTGTSPAPAPVSAASRTASTTGIGLGCIARSSSGRWKGICEQKQQQWDGCVVSAVSLRKIDRSLAFRGV